ncbi:hypothetical protein FQA39_LY03867 [Lamprigera yunnana]|nr:hypothetical protein FQA39_LY03867 [Lamprigera yunnana]
MLTTVIDNISSKISDDEDETHPNIDTPSLFRWRHQARLDRMEEERRAAEEHSKKKEEHNKKLIETSKKLSEAEKHCNTDVDELREAFQKLKKEEEEIKRDAEELEQKKKKSPWNVDTISKDGFAKTIINKKPLKPKDEQLTEEERAAEMKKFVKEHEKELKHFGMLRRYEDSRQFLRQHNYLVCEETANYLVIWCINLQMDEKTDLMGHVAHQTICMQYILELAKQLECDPRACLDTFFSKIQVAEFEYKVTFDDELTQFKERIMKRAEEKLEEARKEAEEEERLQRLGPGGLDPLEVFASLPDDMKNCFETQNITLLQETIAKMDEKEANYHMLRCVDSGLWIPDAKSLKKNSEDGNETTEKEETAD